MVAPEAREDDAASDAPLLLGRVQAARVQETELNPGCGGVAVGESSLVLVPVVVRLVVQLSSVRESVATVVLQQILVLTLEVLREVNSSLTLLPLSNLLT